MTDTLAQLTQPMTVAEATTAIYAALAARGVAVTNWKALGVARTLIAAFAILVAALSTLQAALGKSGFRTLAVGPWLDAVAWYVYGVKRGRGSFATGTLTLTNTGGGVYSFAPFAAKFSNGVKTYTNTAAVALGSMGTQTVAIQALELGSASSTGAATITTLVTPMNGVTCSNAAALVGLDPDLDATLNLLCAEKLGTLSPNGAPDAYVFVSRQATRANGSSIGITRVRTVPDGIGGIDLYVATPTGGVTGSTGPSVGDLGAVDDLIQAQVVPRAITCRTHSATAQSIGGTYELWIPSNNAQTDTQIDAAVQLAYATFLGARPIGGDDTGSGGKVYAGAIESVIGSVVPGTIEVAMGGAAAFDVTISGPSYCPVAGTMTKVAIHRVAGSLI